MPIRSSRNISRIKYIINAIELFPRKTSLFVFRSFPEISILQKTHELKSNSDETSRRHMLVKSIAAQQFMQMAARDPWSATTQKSPSGGVTDPETTGFSFSHRTGTFSGDRCPLRLEAMLARALKEPSCKACAEPGTRHAVRLNGSSFYWWVYNGSCKDHFRFIQHLLEQVSYQGTCVLYLKQNNGDLQVHKHLNFGSLFWTRARSKQNSSLILKTITEQKHHCLASPTLWHIFAHAICTGICNLSPCCL